MKLIKVNKNGVVQPEMKMRRKNMMKKNMTIGMMSRIGSEVIFRPIISLKKVSTFLTPLIPALQGMFLRMKVIM